MKDQKVTGCFMSDFMTLLSFVTLPMFWFGFHLVAVTQTISFEPSLIQTETTEMALDAEGG